MTIEEVLKAQGLTDDQIKAVAASMKENKIFTAGAENMDIRYGKLKGDFDNLTAQHAESTKLIEQLQKGNKDNQTLHQQVTDYQAQIGQLQSQLKQSQVDSAVKVALIGAKAVDVDYLTYKLKEKGELELDDQGNIKGLDDKLAGLKTQFPTQFESSQQTRTVVPQKLPDSDKRETEPRTLAEALKAKYEPETTGKE